MNESSTSRKFASGQTRASSGVRLAALRGGSAAAICRSLVCRALPGVFVSFGVFVIAESPLGAAAGRSNAPYVRVSLDPSPEAVLRSEGQLLFRSQSPATIVTSHEPMLPEPAASSFAQLAAGRTGSAGDVQSEDHGAALDLLSDWALTSGAIDAGQNETPFAFASFSTAGVPTISGLIEQVAVPRIALDMSAFSFDGFALGLSDMVQGSASGAAGKLDPVIDTVTAALDHVVAEPLVIWDAVRALGDSLLSGAALASHTAGAASLSSDTNPGQQAPTGDGPGPVRPAEGILHSAVAVRLQDVITTASVMEAVGLLGLGTAMTRSAKPGGNPRAVAWLQTEKAAAKDWPQHTTSPSAAAHAPVGAMISGFVAQPEPSAPTDRQSHDVTTAENPADESAMPGDIVDLTDGFPLDNAFGPPILVRLGAVVDFFGDRFEAEELERLRISAAYDAYVPLNELTAAGILVDRELLISPLPLHLAAAQSAPGSVGGRANDVSTGGGGGFTGWRQSLSATATAGFDSNPFLLVTDNTAAASLRVQINPTLSRSGERSTIRLSGRAEHIEYLGEYDSLQNFGADFAASRRVSERLEIDGGLTFSSNILATNLANPFANGDVSLDAPVSPIGNDVTILGQGQRRTQYGASAGLTYVLSERDQLSWAASARADRFGTNGLIDSNFFAQQLQYSRRLDEGLTIGAAIDASLIDFVGDGRGDARTVSPQLQVTAALTPRIELSGSAGLAITRLDFGGLTETTTAFAGNVSLCRSGDRSNLCINGSRQVLPAAIGGALLQTAAGLSYSLRLTERDTLQLSGNYGTASQLVGSTRNDFESINGFARYERRLDERMRLFISTGALSTSGNRATDQTNFQGLAGITITLGQAQ